MSGLFAALRGDEFFFDAIKKADPDTFGTSCPCGCYHVGRFSKMEPTEARCPECGDRGSCEMPALGSGPESVKASP